MISKRITIHNPSAPVTAHCEFTGETIEGILADVLVEVSKKILGGAWRIVIVYGSDPDRPPPAAFVADQRPHSRACDSINHHPHGRQCSTNCPTCHGEDE